MTASTRSRLTFLVGAILLPIAIFATVLLWQFASTERARYRLQAEELAAHVTAEVDRELDGLTAALQALATSPALQQGGDLAVFDQQSRALLKTRGDYVSLRDGTGQQIINTSAPFGAKLPRTTDPNVLDADRSVFETGKLAVSNLYTGMLTRLQLVLIGVPVFQDGVVRYVLSISLTPAQLSALLASAGPPDWTISLVDRHDRIIARSRQLNEYLGREVTPDLQRASTGEHGTWVGTTLDGDSVLGGYNRSAISGWRAAVGIPMDTIEAPLRRLTLGLAASTLLVLLLSAALARRFAGSITGPLRQLTVAAVRLGRGDEIPALSTGLREVDEVARAMVFAGGEIKARGSALAESQARLRAVFEAVPVGIVIAEAPTGRIVDGNKQVERIFRHSILYSEHVDEYDAWVSFHPDGRRVTSPEYPLARVIAGQEEHPELEVHHRRGDGSMAWVRLIGAPVQDPNGRLIGGVVAVLDVDQQKQAEAALLQLNATLERRVEDAIAERDRIWRISTELMLVGKFGGEITAINPAWTATLGWTPDDLLGRSLMELVHPDDLERSLREREQIAAGAGALRFENRLRHRDGSYRWVSWTAVPEVGMIHAIGRDITAEKEAEQALRSTEEQLRQSQKMEVVGQLTGGVAHDFNNLLTVVNGNLEMAKRRLETSVGDARLLRYVRNAIEGGQRAAVLTHRLLAFSRQSPLRPEVLELNRIVSGMSDLVRGTLGEAIAIETVLAGGLWQAEADPNQVESAILNLCVNAKDAMPDGGKLTIETANCWLDDAYPAVVRGEIGAGRYVMIAVCDTGAGMSADVRHRVFEPFFTTKPVGKGTGLGLSQVFGFLRQSGGHAAIYSELGEGTTVKLYFPRLAPHATAEPAARAEEAAPLPHGTGETIVVIEDEDMVREFSVAALEDAGYRVFAAGDGPSGLNLLEAHPEASLLFTDVVLAGPLNGRKVADEALRRRPSLNVLFTTGYTRNAIVHHGRLDEDVEVITKPFTASALIEKIQRILP